MWQLPRLVNRSIELGPLNTLAKIREKSFVKMRDYLARSSDNKRGTFIEKFESTLPLKRLLKTPPVCLASETEENRFLENCEKYLRHEFDLLGSGWIEVNRKQNSSDSQFVNFSNSRFSKKVFELLAKHYHPIDWQVDFKSGNRWSEMTWFKDIRIGIPLGADIKVPWELARMQHLVQLAWAFGISKSKNVSRPAEDYAFEFRNQVLDFISTNPPRYGVNWACAMDVGIRVSNWLVAYDLFKSYGAEFGQEFEKIFQQSVFEHGQHLIGNLEWSKEFRSNHYLANIVSLLFVGAYLPPSKEADSWLAFSIQELIEEMIFQFNSDGSNFEASTSYHRLSLEMMVYTTAIVLALPVERIRAIDSAGSLLPRLRSSRVLEFQSQFWKSGTCPLPNSFFESLERALFFSTVIQKPDNTYPQVGDNDSGHFLKVWPRSEQTQAAVVNAGRALFGVSEVGEAPPEACLVKAILKNLSVNSQGSKVPTEFKAFPDFGLFICRNSKFYLSFRCGANGQIGRGGHAHNDQLSFELSYRGENIILDPGTFLYTGAAQERNKFRSSAFHNGLVVAAKEQSPIDFNPARLFDLPDRAQSRIIQFQDNKIVGEHSGYGLICQRSIEIKENGLFVTDSYDSSESKQIRLCLSKDAQISVATATQIEVSINNILVSFSSSQGNWSFENLDYSPEYGVSLKTLWIILSSNDRLVDWRIELKN